MHEFKHEMFGTLRAVDVDGTPWFLLTDPAKALGYRDAERAGRVLRDSQLGTLSKGTASDLGFFGSAPKIVTEGGLYRLIMRSDSPVADRFQDWVTDEVLPAIRKNGSYDVGANDAPAWFREYAAQVDAVVHLAEAHNAVQETSGGYSLAETARRMGMGHHQLTAILKTEGLLTADCVPAKHAIARGYFVRRGSTAAVPESGYEPLRLLVTRYLAKVARAH